MIAFHCAQCRHSLSLKDELAGKKIRCPKCQAVLQVPARPAAVPVAPAKRHSEPDDYTPYGIEPILEIPEEIRGNKVDELVKVANRQKARNRAWNQVGLPAKWLKICALIFVTLWLATFAYVTLASVLYLHKYEQFIRKVEGGPKSLNDLRWMWPVSEVVDRDAAPGYVFGIACSIFFPVMIIYGFILAGAESMKRLERYRLAMTGAILGILMMPPVAIMAIFALRRPEVQYEFTISRLRREGVEDPYALLEAEAEAEAAEEEDDEDEEEEDDEPAPPRSRR